MDSLYAEIITIGDEILIGQIVDTNAAFIAKQLTKIGVAVYQITSVQDDRVHMLQALADAKEHAQIVIVTGGLGPTKDDITKQVFCEFFNDTLIENAEVLANVEHLFKKYITSTPISDINRRQAMVPSKATVLDNPHGTAPGMWMQSGETVFVSLPGVPFEMKSLVRNAVIPKIIEQFERPVIVHKTLVTYGLGESAVAAKIESWENELPDFVRLAYLPSLGRVRLRLTAKGKDKDTLEDTIDGEIQKLPALIGDIMYGIEDEETLEKVVSKMLTRKKLTLATAESCTGGKIAQQLTALPGASAYFKGSVVSYATETKINVLKVPRETIDAHSVVSAEVAKAMAENVRHLLHTDFAIATTGNAGPTKGDSDAEVGTVFVAIASENGVFAQKFNMGNHRTRIVQKSVHKALELLQKEILKF
ncbi:competence/damage-inducible protein A [Pricia sp. S334]|uniref:CinA-like protein n=1 Tax=Pricia mediterranea TaxID=3076079 RepID=A0ABU3L1M4_9FLAO|nr:competence/damage-inducible protein A [Pricia sp. S334]MDT7827629.1 competence/damage-inducible protein A [Pricia sp. S334]